MAVPNALRTKATRRHLEQIAVCDPWFDKGQKSDKTSDMKRITAREFQKEFGKLIKSLPAGETVEITLHGKPLGQFTKGQRRKVKMPHGKEQVARGIRTTFRMNRAFRVTPSVPCHSVV